MVEEMELREQLLAGTLAVFNRKGLKFTMDDIAKELRISKKTIYTVYRDKETMFLAMVDYLFDSIKEGEKQVVEAENLSTVEKIRQILGVLPEGYKEIDFRQLYLLKDKYPVIYEQVEKRLETGWETTLLLLQKGQQEGVVRNVSLPIVKTMFEASLEQFFRRDVLVQHDISYQNALQEVVDIIMGGIVSAEADRPPCRNLKTDSEGEGRETA